MAREVQQLEPLEAYFVVKELGVESATPLLRHVSKNQLQAFVDLDCWRGDHPEADELDAWLAPFAAEGSPVLARAFLSLDEELQVVFLARSLRIFAEREDEVPDRAVGVSRKTTPDQFFVLEVPQKSDREVDLFVLVEALYAEDVNEAFRLLTAARWELLSPLEEQAHRFRQGRLEDLGFPPRDEALALLSPPPRQPRFPHGRGAPVVPTALPALYAGALETTSLLTAALAHIDDPTLLEALENEYVVCVNTAVVAFDESPYDLAHVRRVVRRVRDTVSIGLETLITAKEASQSDSATAAGLLRQWSMSDLFRQGYAELQTLAEPAHRLANDPVIATWLAPVAVEEQDYGPDRLDREFLRGLLARFPEHGGFDPAQPTRRASFASREELGAAATRFDEVARQRS